MMKYAEPKMIVKKYDRIYTNELSTVAANELTAQNNVLNALQENQTSQTTVTVYKLNLNSLGE